MRLSLKTIERWLYIAHRTPRALEAVAREVPKSARTRPAVSAAVGSGRKLDWSRVTEASSFEATFSTPSTYSDGHFYVRMLAHEAWRKVHSGGRTVV